MAQIPSTFELEMDRLNGERKDRLERKISVDRDLLETFAKDEEDVIDHVR